ncbi:MAG: hypothetical protein JRI25_06780 [Deltaproteobacteria bacterium]|nr:hypothetical protein [Deltaproteobacteria bacterium]
MKRYRATVAVAMAGLMAPSALAGVTIGDDFAGQGMDVIANITCGITVTTTAATDGPGTGLVGGGFVPGGAGVSDTVGLENITPGLTSGDILAFGGNQYTNGTSLIAVGEIDVQADHSCPNGVSIGVRRTAAPSGANPAATLNISFNGHQGTGWETSTHFELVGGTSLQTGGGQPTGTVVHTDVAMVFPTGSQVPGDTFASLEYFAQVSP